MQEVNKNEDYLLPTCQSCISSRRVVKHEVLPVVKSAQLLKPSMNLLIIYGGRASACTSSIIIILDMLCSCMYKEVYKEALVKVDLSGVPCSPLLPVPRA